MVFLRKSNLRKKNNKSQINIIVTIVRLAERKPIDLNMCPLKSVNNRDTISIQLNTSPAHMLCGSGYVNSTINSNANVIPAPAQIL